MEFGLLLQETHVFSTLWKVRLCLFFVGTHLHLPVFMTVGPVGGQDILHVYTYTLSYQDHLAEEVSVCLQNLILAFHSGMSLC